MGRIEYHMSKILQTIASTNSFLGGAGFLIGGTAGILKATTPGLFATVSGIQCFTLGTTFWASRTFILQAWTPTKHAPSPSDRTKASALAGGISGGASGLLFRGRQNALPGALVLAAFGFVGQTVVNRWQARPVDDKPSKGFWRSITPEFSWMRHMSNEEYAGMLREKLMKVDVEIAVLDDKIAALRKEAEAQDETKKPSESEKKPRE